jgi:hypothetical protein
MNSQLAPASFRCLLNSPRLRGNMIRRSPRRGPKKWAINGTIVPIHKVVSTRQPSNATVSAGSDIAVPGAREQEWVQSHWREYAGRWVALDGSRLVGEAGLAREALEKARAAGVSSPFLAHVTEPSEQPFGGW